jgi:hypothetical protein
MSVQTTARWTKLFAGITVVCALGAAIFPIGGMCAGPGMLFLLLGLPFLPLAIIFGCLWMIKSAREHNHSLQ